ncbi:MAG: MFS transporter [Candidatus Baldrarchaeia archaeon]
MKRNIVILSLIAFVVNLGFGAIMPIMPFLLLSLEGIITEIPEKLGSIEGAEMYAFQFGLMTSSFMLTRAFLATYFGKLSDKIGRKPLIIAGLMIYTLLSYIYTLAQNWVHLVLTRAVQGVASAMVWPVAEALLVDTVGIEERGKYMGWYMTLSNLGFIVGPSIGAYLYKLGVYFFNLGVPECFVFPFYLLTVLAGATSILAFAAREVVVSGESGTIDAKIDCGSEVFKVPKKIRRSLYTIYFMGFANGIAMGLVFPIVSLFIMQYVTTDPAAQGIISTVSGFVGFLANYPAGIASDKKGRKPVVITGQLISRTSTLLLPFSKKVSDLIIISSVRSAAFNASSPAMRALQADLAPKQIRGKIFGTVQSFFNFGAVIGPLLGSKIYELSFSLTINLFGLILPGVSISFWISSFIGFITLVAFILLVEEPRRNVKD